MIHVTFRRSNPCSSCPEDHSCYLLPSGEQDRGLEQTVHRTPNDRPCIQPEAEGTQKCHQRELLVGKPLPRVVLHTETWNHSGVPFPYRQPTCRYRIPG